MPLGEDPGPDPAKRRRRFALLVFFLALIGLLIFAFRAVLAPFLVAIFIAYLIDPVIERIARVRVAGRVTLGRGGGIIVFYVFLIGLFYLAGLFAIPALGRQVSQLPRDLPKVRSFVEEQAQRIEKKLAELQSKTAERPEAPPDTEADEPAPAGRTDRIRLELEGGGAIEGELVDETEDQLVLRLGGEFEVVERDRVEHETRSEAGSGPSNLKQLIDRGIRQGTQHLDSVLRFSITAVRSLIGALYQLILILMITAFVVIDRQTIARFLHRLPPPHRQRTFDRLMDYFDRGLAGVIRGQLAICGVNGVLTWIGLQLFGVRYPLLLGFVAGVFSLVPIFGTIMSTLPIVLIAWATSGIEQALLALGWILIIHFLEANFLNPKIMGAASKIHPVVVIFALLAGGHAYGLAGALLAVPAASLLQSAFVFFVIDRQAELEG